VVITGFNPVSLWGVRQYLTRLGASPYLPREGRFLARPRIKDWLKLLSFDVERGRFGCYVPSVLQEHWLARWQFMEKAGDRCLAAQDLDSLSLSSWGTSLATMQHEALYSRLFRS